jgi:hypothetical protein
MTALSSAGSFSASWKARSSPASERRAWAASSLAPQNAQAGDGSVIMTNLADAPRLDAVYGHGNWVKMQYVRRNQDGTAMATVHYFKNLTTGEAVEFKFTK